MNPFPQFPSNPSPPEFSLFVVKRSCSIPSWPNYPLLKHDLSFRRFDVISRGFLLILSFRSMKTNGNL